MRTFLGDMAMTARLIRGLPDYLRNPITHDESLAIVRRRLQDRASDFLYLVRRAIMETPGSPYVLLLQMAGCEFGDLEKLVRTEGVEGALRALARAGVYLTNNEFKGRKQIVRGSVMLEVTQATLRNPLSIPHFSAATSGSRGAATSVQLDLGSVRDRAVNMNLALGAGGGANWRTAIWGLRGTTPLLWYSGAGTPAARWFVLPSPGSLGLHSRFRWSARIITMTSRFTGVPLPSPEFVPLDAPLPIVMWIQETLRAGQVPHLWSSPSAAVRVCRSAREAGFDLTGARFTITGEPVTQARLAAIRESGSRALPDYGCVESGGSVACGCLSPNAPDDVHLFSDLNALIHAEGNGLPKNALLLTSLRPTTPYVLLNVSFGDSAMITNRACGCPLETLGWRTHMHTIRSYEKLTAGGVTFDDTAIIKILEEVLPMAFGGGPTDYQIVESEGRSGEPELSLLIHPSIGPVDSAAVSNAFLDAVGAGSENRRDMAAQWQKAGFPRVTREAPHVTGSGKILHLVAARGDSRPRNA